MYWQLAGPSPLPTLEMLHDRASIFIEDDTWYLLVHTVCKHLGEDNRCGIYATRPQICRDYTLDECERFGPQEDSVILFQSAEELEKYAKDEGLYEQESNTHTD